MPYSVVDKPSKYFDTKLYTGNGSTQTITGLNFKPDLLWIKERSGTGASTAYHVWFDGVRGVTKAIYSNDTSAEVTGTALTSFNSDGFTLSLDTSQGRTNDNADSYVAWNWLAGGTGVSNTAGSISSTVSANTTSGFSIVSYTGNGSNSTVGHGLGVAPKFIIFKNRSSTTGWACYNVNIGASKYLALNETIEAQTATGVSNSTDPTSSVFSIGTADRVNTNGNNYIAYCFADVKGFSKAFSYTGNGSTDGNFVYCGFRPAFVLIKNTSIAQDWFINDNKRLGYNGGNNVLYPDLSSAEATSPQVDILSNGFKTRTVDAMINNSGYTYVGFAFAEQPFVSSKGLPTTAR